MKKQMLKKLTAVLLTLAMLPVFSLFTAAEDNIVSGGSLNSTYAVIALIAILGFAFVAKKKENE